MVLDVVVIILFLIMLLYGYIKGLVKIVAKIVSLILAIALAYMFAGGVGDYISNTKFGIYLKNGIENTVMEKLSNEQDGIEEQEDKVMTVIKEKIENNIQENVVDVVTKYAFIGLGFVVVYIITRLILWIVEKILESIFELPILKTFNRLGGVIVSGTLFIVELSIVLAIISGISYAPFMSRTISVINSSVITKALYGYNIFTNLIMSKII